MVFESTGERKDIAALCRTYISSDRHYRISHYGIPPTNGATLSPVVGRFCSLSIYRICFTAISLWLGS
jgi:hypothetical protein